MHNSCRAFMGSAVLVGGEVSMERLERGGAHVAEAFCHSKVVEGRVVDDALVARGLGGAYVSPEDSGDSF